MKKVVIAISVILTLMVARFASAQNQADEKKFGISFRGFIKSDYWYDSRQVVSAREDLFMIVPTNTLPDKNGKDINAHPSFNYSAITTRITGDIKGPDAFGAKTSGMIEADFSGVTNGDINGFRLRHAIGKLRWEKSELMFGQFWHPMFVVDVFPQVISLNTGAPFQPFIRNPQIGYTRFIDTYSLNLSFVTQRDHASEGPSGALPNYMKNALIPNVHLQLQHKTPTRIWGFAADYKVLQPRLVTDNNYQTNETIGSYAFMAYHKYVNKNFLWSMKGIFGQNLTEHLMMGGYAVRTVNPDTKIETYTPTNHLNLWNYISYGQAVKFGLYCGYLKNLGTTHENTGRYFGRGKDIGYVYRIAPSLSFISAKTQISTELEYTAAGYGTPDTKGIVQNINETKNLRLLVTFYYYF